MDRLTIRLEDQWGNLTDSIILRPYMRYEDEKVKKLILDRLASYEDTGLEPEDIEIGWWSPVCINCDGKTDDGHRTEKCTYVHSDDTNMNHHKCAEQSRLLYKLAKAYKDGKLVMPE